MDRALKERIIGAIVLVVFVILVVPIFLDGPPSDDEILSETVVLPGQSDQKMQTQVLNRDRETPVAEPTVKPVAAASVEAASSRDESGQDAPPTVTEQDATPTDAQPTSVTGMWAVQLGSFSDQANAEKLAAELRKQGFFAVLSKLDTDKGPLHRVRIGPQADRAAAESVVKKLAAAGHKGQVVPHP